MIPTKEKDSDNDRAEKQKMIVDMYNNGITDTQDAIISMLGLVPSSFSDDGKTVFTNLLPIATL
jgi:hypothetical protein